MDINGRGATARLFDMYLRVVKQSPSESQLALYQNGAKKANGSLLVVPRA